MRKISLIVIVVLLTSVVGYLAMDRSDKNTAQQQEKEFKEQMLK